jgi:pyruvate ferredoxin oxidoreductase gamma subunit/phenylglyoxylate dehydrogenase gamma subunit
VASFLRMDTREIRQMTNIYRPDCVLCIDPTVGRAVNVFDGIKDNGTWIQTTARPIGELQIFKRPITNTLMLGAFAKTTGLVSLDSLRAAVEDSDFRDAGLKQNLLALERGYDETIVHKIERKVAA